MWIDSSTKVESWSEITVRGQRDIHAVSVWSDVVTYGLQIAGGYVGIVWTETVGRGGGRHRLQTALSSEHHILLFDVQPHAYVMVDGERDQPIGGLLHTTRRLHSWLGKQYPDGHWDLDRFREALIAYGSENVTEMEELWR